MQAKLVKESFIFENSLDNIKKEDIINKDLINNYIGQGSNDELFMYTYAKEHNLNIEDINLETWENSKEIRGWIKYKIENLYNETIEIYLNMK